MSDGREVAEREAAEVDVKRDARFSRDRLDALAEHFDATDAADLPWEEATDVEIERPQLEQISIRLPKEDLAQLKALASKAGVGYTTLVRMILRRHLREAKAKAISADSASLPKKELAK
jgi:predicted DNA binding CopG/RHH family protein